MATYSRKSSSNRGIRIKRVPQKDVIPIDKPEDSYRCGEETEIGDKSADEAVEKIYRLIFPTKMLLWYTLRPTKMADNDNIH